jgi:DNA invertase Pin-like site-specific DNA recombinase
LKEKEFKKHLKLVNMNTEKKYVAYYRVSTKQQGNSGLGLDAQRETVTKFVNCSKCIIKEFTEVESGKNDQRAELEKAIQFAQKNKATLLIAKLDRLSRNAAFIFQLRDAKVDFVCCDMPDANTLTIGIFATLAQYERELISSRTVAALNARKEKVGEWRKGYKFSDQERGEAAAKVTAKAATNKNTMLAKGYAKRLQADGLTLEAIAARLNTEGHKAPQGGTFAKIQVKRLLAK